MKYCLSDIHGEYELFVRLIEKINFSENDVMYVCGDIIEKGKDSVRLAQLISSYSNIHCILGNHELSFLRYYRSLMEKSPDDFEKVLKKLQEYFPEDGDLLDWALVDWFDELPSYIEEDDFICVHAGIPLDGENKLLPLARIDTEYLVNDRKFKDPNLAHNDSKCVFFGHTPTEYLYGENRIITYARNPSKTLENIDDLYKVHLDTGAWSSGILGCFCIDNLECIYVKKQ